MQAAVKNLTRDVAVVKLLDDETGETLTLVWDRATTAGRADSVEVVHQDDADDEGTVVARKQVKLGSHAR